MAAFWGLLLLLLLLKIMTMVMIMVTIVEMMVMMMMVMMMVMLPDDGQITDPSCRLVAAAADDVGCSEQCDFLAEVFGLQKVGWVFSQADQEGVDYIMSSSEVSGGVSSGGVAMQPPVAGCPPGGEAICPSQQESHPPLLPGLSCLSVYCLSVSACQSQPPHWPWLWLFHGQHYPAAAAAAAAFVVDLVTVASPPGCFGQLK
jgi:hypothetical protein